jgi:hypothetical protein
MKGEAATREQDKAVGAVADAEEAAASGTRTLAEIADALNARGVPTARAALGHG